MEVQQLAPGLWRWTGQHPDWKPKDAGPTGWDQEVGCVYFEGEDAVCLIDPLVPPEDPERFWKALDGDVERVGLPVAVALTVGWHERSAAEIVERYDAVLWKPADGTPPGGLQAVIAADHEEALLWSRTHRTLVTGDSILGDGNGGLRLCPSSWLPKGTTAAAFRQSLRPLLELGVERVLVSHGEPVLAGGHEALVRALSA